MTIIFYNYCLHNKETKVKKLVVFSFCIKPNELRSTRTYFLHIKVLFSNNIVDLYMRLSVSNMILINTFPKWLYHMRRMLIKFPPKNNGQRSLHLLPIKKMLCSWGIPFLLRWTLSPPLLLCYCLATCKVASNNKMSQNKLDVCHPLWQFK